jgi:Protein of unknown function (DUF2946)
MRPREKGDVSPSGWRENGSGRIISGMQRVRHPRVNRARSLLRRTAGWTVAFAMLVNVATIMPLMLRMAIAGPVMVMANGLPCPMHTASNMEGKGPVHGTPPCDHAHCLICQGGIGTAVLGSPIPPVAAPLKVITVIFEHRTIFIAQPFRTSYISRAPPLAI